MAGFHTPIRPPRSGRRTVTTAGPSWNRTSTDQAGYLKPGTGPTLSEGTSPAWSTGPGAGNSPFGLGWHVGAPGIARKTSRGVPTYTDSDVFVLGGDDLVPLLQPDGSGGFAAYDEPATIDGVARRVRRFRPRTETGYTRVEQCRDPATGDVFWRTVSRNNVTMVFGRSAASRIHDPADPAATRRVAEWLLDEVSDDRGNVARYEYKAEDTAGVPPSVYEGHRQASTAPPAGRYLKYVRYANATPDDGSSARLVVAFDYGEHDEAIAETDRGRRGRTRSRRTGRASSYAPGGCAGGSWCSTTSEPTSGRARCRDWFARSS